MVCLFGQARKRPWQSKSKKMQPVCKLTDNAPGKQVSMDQMVSAQPGLISHMGGRLKNLWIMGATIFVDHFSDHVYVYLMKDQTLADTLLEKHAYEKYLALLGVESARRQGYEGAY